MVNGLLTKIAFSQDGWRLAKVFCFSFKRLLKKEQDQYPAIMNEQMTKLGLKRNIVWPINWTQRG